MATAIIKSFSLIVSSQDLALTHHDTLSKARFSVESCSWLSLWLCAACGWHMRLCEAGALARVVQTIGYVACPPIATNLWQQRPFCGRLTGCTTTRETDRTATTPRPQRCAACRSYAATPRLPLAACRSQVLLRQRVGRREARTSDGLAVTSREAPPALCASLLGVNLHSATSWPSSRASWSR